jgi:hypothetical protein
VVVLSGICTLCFAYRAAFVVTLPQREYGNIGAAASYLLAGEVVPLTILLGAFYLLPRAWRRSVRAGGGDHGADDDMADDPTLDGLLARQAPTASASGGGTLEDDWEVVAAADSPGTPPPRLGPGAKGVIADAPSPTPSYGAILR